MKANGVRTELDDRTNYTAGWKYNHWEQKGVPLRIEIGGRDITGKTTFSARRDVPGKEGKKAIAWEGFVESVKEMVDFHLNISWTPYKKICSQGQKQPETLESLV